MSGLLMEQLHFVKGLDPVADVFDSTQTSDVVSMKDWNRILFAIYIGVGATGTSTITVEACDDVVPSNTSAIAFRYRQELTLDTEGAITAAASTGFVYTAGSSKIILVEVAAQDLLASGYSFVRLKAVESVNSPVLGGILVIQGEPRDRPAIARTTIA
jgi:hypothetical protein